MRLEMLAFKGFFQESATETAEHLQLMAPDSPIDQAMLAWAILPLPQTVNDDIARTDYVFQYHLGEHLRDGLFVLRMTCSDASKVRHEVELAAGLVAVAGTVEQARGGRFARIWFLSKHLHYKPITPDMEDHYHRPAFGHLTFDSSANLPHRRLFGARV